VAFQEGEASVAFQEGVCHQEGETASQEPLDGPVLVSSLLAFPKAA